MIIPLDRLIDNRENVYEMTCAAIRRAVQITLTDDEEIHKNDGKVVSVALKQVLTKQVDFRLEEK
jgi:DNA-directed RNA polymerase subunit omega